MDSPSTSRKRSTPSAASHSSPQLEHKGESRKKQVPGAVVETVLASPIAAVTTQPASASVGQAGAAGGSPDTGSGAGGGAGASASASSGSATAVTRKRQDYLPWDDYFMAVAFLSSQRSKDPSTQVGACIVSEEKKIVGIGYNGFPNGCSDDELPWSRTAACELDTKYPYVCHAEMNAILNKNTENLKGCKMYVALFPCNECAKLIIQSGIAQVIYRSDKYHDSKKMIASRRLLDMAGVKYTQFTPRAREIRIRFEDV